MDKKSVTFLVVSNSRGKTWRYVVSAAWIRAGIIAFSIFALIGVAVVVDYMGLLVQSAENKELRADNLQLNKQFQVVEGKLNSLEVSLDRVKTFAKKLRLITNVDDSDRNLQLAIGPLPRVGQAVDNLTEPLDNRAPAGVLATEDSVFFKKKPVAVAAGELTAAGTRDYASISIRIDQAIKETQLQEQGILDLWRTFSDKQALMNATPSIKPARGWYTSKFGYRISPFTGRPAMHNGLDIAAPPGTPIVAPADGIVSYAGWDSSYGKLVAIDHGYGVTTRFGHTSQIFVHVGERVKRRDVIAAVGSTGRSTGPHVHYEVRVNGVPVDPINYILGNY